MAMATFLVCGFLCVKRPKKFDMPRPFVGEKKRLLPLIYTARSLKILSFSLSLNKQSKAQSTHGILASF
jgi:hypothetical protein